MSYDEEMEEGGEGRKKKEYDCNDPDKKGWIDEWIDSAPEEE